MKENDELSNVEKEWKSRFDRFTAPEPTREQSISLIEKIKGEAATKPIDMRIELETAQQTQSTSERITNLLLSQWNFQGTRSWLFTAIVMLVLTITIHQSWGEGATRFTLWIKWVSLIMIAMMGYAFRPKNEGNDMIERLSYIPLIQQMFTRFIIVLLVQLIIALPLSFIVLGGTTSALHVLSSFTPLLFFGVVGFIGTIWLGQKLGALLALGIWFGQVVLGNKLKFASLFQVPGDDYFLLMNGIVLGISFLLLSSMLLENRKLGNEI